MLIRINILAFLLLLVVGSFAQGIPDDYNPFVSANLDDPAKLDNRFSVVASSYHKYKVTGDQNYTDPSTFVWYVENGEFGIYDQASDTWSPYSEFPVLELLGTAIDGVENSSEVWVRWHEDKEGETGYIAVYERSSNNCILDQDLQGYKHLIKPRPEVWFIGSDGSNEMEACANDPFAVTIEMNNVSDSISYPYMIRYTYPNPNGNIVEDTLIINYGDLGLDHKYYTIDFDAIIMEFDETEDKKYDITLLELRDKYRAEGEIAPLRDIKPQYQYEKTIIRISHLPQTGDVELN